MTVRPLNGGMIHRRTSHQQQRGIGEPAAMAAGFAFGMDLDNKQRCPGNCDHGHSVRLPKPNSLS